MKRIIIIFSLLVLFSIDVYASSYMFVWNEGTTYVAVPLNANILDYIDQPKAELYCDGNLMSDTNIVYNYNGDWLYLLTDVDTSKVGDYMVWYKVSETNYKPGQCQGYKTLVTFHVVDKQPPKIIDMLDNITYRIGNEKPNYLDWITVIDDSGYCDVKILDDEVDYTCVGSFDAYVMATDGYNPIKKKFMVNVIDEEGPRIKYLGDSKGIVIPLGEEEDIASYFTAVDDVDGDVSYSISYKEVNTLVEGKQVITVSFSDLQGNVSSMEVVVWIVDETEPEIILKQESLLLDYETDFNNYNFLDNIYSAYDGKKDISNLVFVDFSLLVNEVGVYTIYYKYDDNGNIYTVSCQVHLLSNKSPVVNTNDIEIEEGDLPNYSDYIDVVDPSDITILESTQIDDSRVDYSTSGTYPVYITVTNSSGLSTTETLFVTIVEEEKKEMDWKMGVICVMGLYFVGSKTIEFIRRKRSQSSL